MDANRLHVSIVTVVLAVAAAGCTTAPGGSSSTNPTRMPAAATAGPSVAASTPGDPTETFTSKIHGISISYPVGWVPRAATKPWPPGEILMQQAEFADVIEDGSLEDSAFIAIGSQPFGDDAVAFRDWSTGVLAYEECGPTTPVTVDGQSGELGTGCPMALVLVEGRGYLIWLYRLDDREWFKGVLATVRFHPEDAILAAP